MSAEIQMINTSHQHELDLFSVFRMEHVEIYVSIYIYIYILALA